MILKELTINNFARIKHIDINAGKPELIQVLGVNEDTGKSNESGKSTIFNALCWCLYGKYPAGGGRLGDEVVNPLVGKDCSVAVKLMDGDISYIIGRSRKHSNEGNKLVISVIEDNKIEHQDIYELGLKSNNAHNAMIESIVGMDYDSFIRSYYLPQEGVDPFGRMTDKELKTFMLEKLLDLNWLPDAHISTKESRGYLEVHLMEKCTEILKYEEKMNDAKIRIDSYLKKEAIWWEDRTTQRAIVEKDLQELNDNLKIVEDNKEKIEEKIKELELAITVTRDDVDWTAMLAKANKKYADMCSTVSGLEPKINLYQEQYEEGAQELEIIDSKVGTECIVCGNVISQENLPTMRKAILQTMKEAKKKFNEIELPYQEAVMEKSALASELVGLQKRIDEAIEKQKQITEFRKKIDDLVEMTDIKSIQTQIQLKTDTLKQWDNVVSPYNILVNEEKDVIDLNETLLKQVTVDKKDIEYKLNQVKFWEHAFSSKGIQSFILDSVTNTLNVFISDYLNDLTDGRITVRLNTVKKLKSGEFRENFNITVNNMDGGSSYASLSGGAKRRVDLAISLAVSRFKRAVSEKELKLMIMDEICNGMDSYWIEKTIEMVIEKFRDYSVFFISHQDINPVYFDDTIKVVKRNGITMVE